MSARRFTDKPDLNPQAVMTLADDHPAMVENRTLFPTTVVTVTEDEPDRLLISGRNNRKLGETVEKGKFKGYALYQLSLEERATCPADCDARGICYGNSMQLARRHRIGNPDVFFDRLGMEVADLLDDHAGLLIRLHVLGDFPSVEYVSFWKEVLDEYPNVACYGYTHRAPLSWGGDEIGEAIQAVKDAYPDRFRIRWSTVVARADGAMIIGAVPAGPRDENNSLVCPAQTDATACCATCGLCWEASAKRECIGFIRHGRMSADVEAASIMDDMRKPEPAGQEAPPVASVGDLRPIRPISVQGLSPSAVRVARPLFIDVDPKSLIVETKYQRDLSAKSLKLIRRIVERFEWTKFKPPVCVAHGDKYFVIDGQHTAIAAASHPDVATIPIMVVDAATVEERAASFVAHNRDRVAMSPYQVFHGEVAAGEEAAVAIFNTVTNAGGIIPRNPPTQGQYKVGQVSAVGELYKIVSAHGVDLLRDIISIAIEARCKPISKTVMCALRIILTQPQYEGVSKHDLTTALMARPDIDQAAYRFGAETNQSTYNAAAVLLYRAT